MAADEIDLCALDDYVRFLDLDMPRADRLDLPAFQRHAGLEAFFDEIVVEGLLVLDDAHDGVNFCCGSCILPTLPRLPGSISMALVEKSVLIEYSAAQMYALVENIAAYPEFLPWCGGAEILEKEGDITRAAITIDFRGIKQRFSTENHAHPPQLIEMNLIDRAFRPPDGNVRLKGLGG